jgi:hypothetical protein
MKKASRALLPALLVVCLAAATPAFAGSLDYFSITDGYTGAIYTFSLAASPAPPDFSTSTYFEMENVSMLVNGTPETGNVYFQDSSSGGGSQIYGTTITLDDVGIGNFQLFQGTNTAPTFNLGQFTMDNDTYRTNPLDDATITISNTPISPAPEPGSLILLGTGVLGMAGAIRRRLAI